MSEIDVPNLIDKAILLDNPLLTKHVRSRLRIAAMMPWAIIVVVLCLIVVYGAFATRSLGTNFPTSALIMLQTIILVFIGSQQIAASVGGSRESGLLDFHRVSPTPPLWNAVGVFLGAPIREYLLVALTLPFAMFLGFSSSYGIGAWIGAELVLLCVALNFHAISLVSNLTSKKPKASGRGVVGLLVVGYFAMSWIMGAIFGGAGPRAMGSGNIVFHGLEMPWLVLMLAAEIPILTLLLIPAVRKMRSEREHLYSKRQAVACMAIVAFLGVGLSTNFKNQPATTIVLLYVLTGLGVVLGACVTPTRSGYLKAVRRAIHAGRRRPGAWADDGVNRACVATLGVIVLVATTVTWEFVEGRGTSGKSQSLAIAIGVLVILYMGFGLQVAQLTLAKRASSYFVLFVFFIWAVPLIVGSLGQASAMPSRESYAIMGVSPLAGIALASDGVTGFDEAWNLGKIGAIAPAVTFAVLFFFFLEQAQRRLDREVRSTLPAPMEIDPWSDEPPDGGKPDSKAIAEI